MDSTSESMDVDTSQASTSTKNKSKIGKTVQTRLSQEVIMSKCARLLDDLINRKTHSAYTWPFVQPVDPIENQCEDYFDVIKTPMDLGTMQKKMQSGEYKTPDQFENDIKLIINNCLIYNSPNHKIIPICEKFKEAFEVRFEKIKNPKKRIIPSPRTDEGSFLIRRTSRSFSNGNYIIGDDRKYILKEISRTEAYLKDLYEKLEYLEEDKKNSEMVIMVDWNKIKNKQAKKENEKKEAKKVKAQKKDNTPAQKPSKNLLPLFNSVPTTTSNSVQNGKVKPSQLSDSDTDDEMDEMTHDQKRELVQAINKLPSDNVREVSKIIRESEPNCYKQNGKKGFEIDFTTCSTRTLLAIEKYVKSTLHPKEPRAVPFPRKEKLVKDPELVQQLKEELDTERKTCENKLSNWKERFQQFCRKKDNKESTKLSESSDSSSSDSDTTSGSSSSSSSDDEN